MQLQYKKCDLSDLNLLRDLSEETFVDAFEKHNDPADFKAYVDSAFAIDTIEDELINPNSVFLFCFKR